MRLGVGQRNPKTGAVAASPRKESNMRTMLVTTLLFAALLLAACAQGPQEYIAREQERRETILLEETKRRENLLIEESDRRRTQFERENDRRIQKNREFVYNNFKNTIVIQDGLDGHGLFNLSLGRQYMAQGRYELAKRHLLMALAGAKDEEMRQTLASDIENADRMIRLDR